MSCVLDSVLQKNRKVPLVWQCATLQQLHVQLQKHIPIYEWIVAVAVIKLSINGRDVFRSFLFIHLQV